MFLKERVERAKNSVKERKIFGNVNFFIKDPIVGDVSVGNVIRRLEEVIPTHLTYGLDFVYVGEFKEFEERGINAFYEDGTIYVANTQDDDEDMIDDITHEVAHLVESMHGLEIYGDGDIKAEFLGTRRRLYHIVSAEGYDSTMFKFMKPEYSREFDEFLYEKIGYVNLEALTRGLFRSPYAAVSLSEYFADGFEAYFLKREENYLKDLSPMLYNKLERLSHTGE